MSVNSGQFEPMLHRHIDQVAADIMTECRRSIDRLSVDTRPIVSGYNGLILSTESQSTDALYTHDPIMLLSS